MAFVWVKKPKRRRQSDLKRKLVAVAIVILLLAIWGFASRPENPLHKLRRLGYDCHNLDQSRQTICFDPQRPDDDPESLTRVRVWSPHNPKNNQPLMNIYCPAIDSLVAYGHRPVGWQFDRDLIIGPHEIYNAPEKRPLYQIRQSRLNASVAQTAAKTRAIDLQSRCRYYDNYGLTPFNQPQTTPGSNGH